MIYAYSWNSEIWCSLELKRASVSWRTGIFMLVSQVVTFMSRENMLRIFGCKTHKAKNGANFAHLEKNRPKSINLSNGHLWVLFRGCIWGYPIFIYFHIQTQMLLEIFCTFVWGLTFSLAFEMFFEDCCSGKPTPLQAKKRAKGAVGSRQVWGIQKWSNDLHRK